MDRIPAPDVPEPERLAGVGPTSGARPRIGLCPADIAITGIGAILPGAPDVRRFWENILGKVGAIAEVPADRWPAALYFDPDRDAQDKIASKWGGFIPDVAFDPIRFGIPPASVPSIDPAQLLALVVAEAALADAGLTDIDPELRKRASVILGFTGGLGELGLQYAARAELARALPSIPAETLDFLPRWTSDSFAGLLPNVVAGRIANRFDFGGANFVVDAACATSLATLRQAVLELETGRSDLVLCGAVEVGQGPFAFTCFSKAHALSPGGKCRAFDAAADGTTIAEGIAMVVLRRLADAQAAGDRIYAVIKGIDGSSDGRARGMMAPLPDGQKQALRRAYAQAGYSPATVDLFEAHGTGTVTGDAVELEALSDLLIEDGAAPHTAAVGSVKTLIGHAEGAAGMAGLIKVALGLHHRVLPPHAGVEQPNVELRRPDCPIALQQQAQPWLPRLDAPRRAGVSAFGFGGTNYHVTLEAHAKASAHATRDTWPAELFVWRAEDRTALAAALAPVLAALQAGAKPCLGGLAKALALGIGRGRATLAIVAGSHAALTTLLGHAIERLNEPAGTRPSPPGFHLSDTPLSADGQVTMLFPGQGSQYPDMARELAMTFDEVGAALEAADAVVADTPTYRGRVDPRLSRLVYPFTRFGEDEEEAARHALAATDAAQPALGAVETALLALTARLGIVPSVVAGHSYGEYVALHAAGVLSHADLMRVSEARGRCIVGAMRDGDLGTMAAVAADAATVRGVGDDGVVIANLNAPNQTVISGSRQAVAAAVERCGANGLSAVAIPVSAAFHSPLMQPAQAPLVAFFDAIDWAAPRIPVYANTTAARHESNPARIRIVLERHLTEPVDFMGMVDAMYAAGARVFLEVGPKAVLTTLTRRVLGDRPHAAIALDGAGGGLVGLLHALAALLVQGVAVDLTRLFEGRDLVVIDLAAIDLADLEQTSRKPVATPAAAWLLNGGRARAVDAAPCTTVVPAARNDEWTQEKLTQEKLAQEKLAQEKLAQEKLAQKKRAEEESDATSATQNEARPMKESGMQGFLSPTKVEEDTPADPSGSGLGGSGLVGGELAAGGLERALADHHQMMRQFLQTQERLMLAYINAGERANGGERAPARPFSLPRTTSVPRRAAAPSPEAGSSASAPIVSPAAAPTAPDMPAPPIPVLPVPALSVPAASRPAPAADSTALLLKIASDRTGYPADMLGLDLDMEADLGIDSIKRVEILAAFRKAQPAAVSDLLMPHMARIAKAKTLREVLEGLDAALKEKAGAQLPFDRTGKEQSVAALSRYVMQAATEELPKSLPATLPAGLYLVVPDVTGIAAALSVLLEGSGAKACLVPDGVTANDQDLATWLASVRAMGRIRGIVSLAPASAPETGPRETADWRAGMETNVKSLFALLRLTAPDLAHDGIVAVVSAMGGHFGRDSLRRSARATLFPGAGGGVGLIKSLAMEWPHCLCKAIDLDATELPAQHAAHIYAEMAASTGRREVGYPAGVRTIFRTARRPLDLQAAPVVQPGRDWVVVAVGGARGITAETCRPFAAAGATCIIVGRGALPGPETPTTAALADAAALRMHFLASAPAEDRPTPAKIEARVAAVLRDRETRANMADYVTLGARVDYRMCDVRREADVAALLAGIYARHGRIDAVLFGAGLIEDRLIVDKTRESLARVFDTKVDGAYFFAKHLQPQSLKSFVLFSSVAGRYGNRGQTDYAAANEVLNRFAWQLQAQYGATTKVTSVNWGAWARTTNGPGMLTPETARQFRERGLRLIEPREGRDFLWCELLYAPRDEVEVVAGEHAWEDQEAQAARIPPVAVPAERAVA